MTEEGRGFCCCIQHRTTLELHR